jgi:hypothetical protein
VTGRIGGLLEGGGAGLVGIETPSYRGFRYPADHQPLRGALPPLPRRFPSSSATNGIIPIGDWIRIGLGGEPSTARGWNHAEHAGFLMILQTVGQRIVFGNSVIGAVAELYAKVPASVGHLFNGRAVMKPSLPGSSTAPPPCAIYPHPRPLSP